MISSQLHHKSESDKQMKYKSSNFAKILSGTDDFNTHSVARAAVLIFLSRKREREKRGERVLFPSRNLAKSV